MATLILFQILFGALILYSRKVEGKQQPGKLARDRYETKSIKGQPYDFEYVIPDDIVVTEFYGRRASVLNQDQAPSPDGTFRYSFKTDNGISVEASGYPRYFVAEEPAQGMKGLYSYTAPDGTLIETRWYAEETGFHPKVKYN